MAGGNQAVAIVGMACVMPGAPDHEAFWANIVDGVDSVTEVPTTRWNPALHFDPTFDSSQRTPGDEPMSVSKWGGWIPDVGFDALGWGIPPASLASIDPAQLLALKCAAAALDDAGYGTDGAPFDRERASVIYATGSGGASEIPAGFLFRLLLRNHGVLRDALPPELDAFLPELTEDGLPGVLTSVIAGRVANRLDLGGKNLTVDSACASVLVALDIACNELLGGSSDLVLCGGVDLHNGAQDFISFTAAHALSRSGRCRSFDVDADGMTLAEGAGCLVLKRLADARADGDRIYAVVRGIAGSSDGRHLGLTAPRQQGQERAVRRAYAAAGLSPTEVELVEAHGTGTPTGDRTELRSTTQVFTEAGAAPASVVLGSVKSNIGHTKCAAGVASLIKVAKALYHGVLPPTLHVTQPNEEWDAATSPFVFLDEARPWLGSDERTAAVSSFGFGGTNFHAVLSNDPGTAAPSGRPQWPAELFVFRAATDAALMERLAALSARLADELAPPRQADRWWMRDVAAAIGTEHPDSPVPLAIVAEDLEDLARKVDAARRGRPDPGVYLREEDGVADAGSGSSVAFLLPEPGTASASAVAVLLVAFPALREAADADEVVVAQQALAACGIVPDQVVGSDAVSCDEIRRLFARGVPVFVDLDPTGCQLPLVEGALADVPHVAVGIGQPGQHGLTAFLHALGRLAVAGLDLDLDALHHGRDSRPERWRDPPPRPGWIVNGHYARDASGSSLPKGLHPADEAPVIHVAAGPGPSPERQASGAVASGASHDVRRVIGEPDSSLARTQDEGIAVATSRTRTQPAADLAGDNRRNVVRGPTSIPVDLTPVLEYLALLHETIAAGSDIIRSQVEAAAP